MLKQMKETLNPEQMKPIHKTKELKLQKKSEWEKERERRNLILQIDEEIGERIVDGVDAIGLLGLFDDGLDVADFRDGLEETLLLAVVEAALVLGLLDHLVVVLHQGATKPRFLVLTHHRIEETVTLGKNQIKSMRRTAKTLTLGRKIVQKSLAVDGD